MEYALPPLGTLTTKLAARACGVEPATIRDWVRRGILTRCGGSPRRPLYRWTDVTAAYDDAYSKRPQQRKSTAA
jgi:hypothetical protein